MASLTPANDSILHDRNHYIHFIKQILGIRRRPFSSAAIHINKCARRTQHRISSHKSYVPAAMRRILEIDYRQSAYLRRLVTEITRKSSRWHAEFAPVHQQHRNLPRGTRGTVPPPGPSSNEDLVHRSEDVPLRQSAAAAFQSTKQITVCCDCPRSKPLAWCPARRTGVPGAVAVRRAQPQQESRPRGR